MSNFTLIVERSSESGCWRRLTLILYENSRLSNFRDSSVHRTSGWNEDDLVSDTNFVFDEFLESLSLQFMRPKILQTFYRMRENDSSGDGLETIKLPVVPEEETHSSCRSENRNTFTQEGEIPQCEIKHELLNACSAAVKFFDENQCSVCLGSYKEILDGNLHLVVPSCGHPLCCGCADKILLSPKKECPRCRGSVTAKSFNLMKFKSNLEVNSDQTVFL